MCAFPSLAPRPQSGNACHRGPGAPPPPPESGIRCLTGAGALLELYAPNFLSRPA